MGCSLTDVTVVIVTWDKRCLILVPQASQWQCWWGIETFQDPTRSWDGISNSRTLLAKLGHLEGMLESLFPGTTSASIPHIIVLGKRKANAPSAHAQERRQNGGLATESGTHR